MSNRPIQKSLKLNAIMNAILTMSSFIFPLITFPYVSRILMPAGIGKVSFATSVITYFSIFAQLGIPTYGIRACAKVRDDYKKLSRVVHEIVVINLIMCAIAYIGFFLSLFTVPRLQQDKALFVIISATILLNAVGVEWLYKALEQYTYITVRSIIFKFISLVAMFALIHQKSDYIIYGGISIFAASASNILNFINLRKLISFRPVGNYNYKQHLKMILVFFVMSVATTIYTNLDTVMLGFMKTDDDVGYYNAAVKIKTILVSVVTSVSTVLLPRASYYVDKGLIDDFLKITKKTLNFIVLVALPLMLYFMLFARYGILFLSGAAYEGAIVPMQIIMPTLLFIGITNVLGIQIMIPLGKEKQVLYSEIIGLIVNVAINIILIPKYASAGASIGAVVAELSVLVWQYIDLRDLVKPVFKQMHYISISIALVLSTVGSLWVKALRLSNFLILVISACIFFGVYIVVLTITKESIILELENQMFSKLKNKLVRK